MITGEILTVEDGFRVVARLIRLEHQPGCADLEAWRERAALLDLAADGEANVDEARAIVRAWARHVSSEAEEVPV